MIDLGLRLQDVEAMGLESEYQGHVKGKKRLLIDNVRKNGATQAEIEFMFKDFDKSRCTRRVELNAMTSPQFIAFLEQKLREHGITKVVPEKDELADAYKFFVRNLDLEKAIEHVIKNHKSDEDDIKVPDDLAKQVRKVLSTRKELRWDSAVYKVAGGKIETPPKSKPHRTARPKNQPKVDPLALDDISHRITKVLGKGWSDPLAGRTRK